MLPNCQVVVHQHLPGQAAKMALFFVANDGDEGYALFLESLLPCLARLLSDDRDVVRQAASEALVDVASFVRPPDVGRHVLTVVLRLAHDDENEALRLTAACLLSALSPCLGFDLSHQASALLSRGSGGGAACRDRKVHHFCS